MKVTKPVELLLNSSRVTSNIPELDPTYDSPEWNTASSYVEGDRVSLIANHLVYECIADANSTIASPEIDVISDTPHWIEIGHTNKWHMFCYTHSVPSYKASPLTVTVTPQVRSSNLNLLKLQGCTGITVSATSGGVSTSLINCTPTATGTGTNITKAATLTITGTDITSLIVYNLPANTNIVYVISLTGPGVITCGSCILGWAEDLGDLQSDITRGHLNFSTIDRDTYGTVTIIKRRSVPKLSYSLHNTASEVNRIVAIRDDLNAEVAFWNAMADNVIPDYTNSLMILGFYRDFSIRLDNSVAVTVTLEIEEM